MAVGFVSVAVAIAVAEVVAPVIRIVFEVVSKEIVAEIFWIEARLCGVEIPFHQSFFDWLPLIVMRFEIECDILRSWGDSRDVGCYFEGITAEFLHMKSVAENSVLID